MIAALWILAVLSLLCWSLLLWGVHALLNLDAATVEGWKAALDKLPFAHWLDAWWPGWLDLLVAVVEWTQWLLNGLSDWLLWALWGLWGTGAVLMLVVTALLHALVRASQAPAAKA